MASEEHRAKTPGLQSTQTLVVVVNRRLSFDRPATVSRATTYTSTNLSVVRTRAGAPSPRAAS